MTEHDRYSEIPQWTVPWSNYRNTVIFCHSGAEGSKPISQGGRVPLWTTGHQGAIKADFQGKKATLMATPIQNSHYYMDSRGDLLVDRHTVPVEGRP